MSEPLGLRQIAFIPWGDGIDPIVVDAGPSPGDSFLEIPGPVRRPVRPYLELFASPAGLVGRVVRGDGVALPEAVVPSSAGVTRVPLTRPPRALSLAADGGLWVVEDAALIRLDARGTEVRRHELSAAAAVGVADGVWVLGQGTASFADEAGGIRGPFPWNGGSECVGFGNLVCVLTPGNPGTARCLDPNGRESTHRLSGRPQPFERLLALHEGGDAITMDASVVRRYAAQGSESQFAVQAGGLSSSGAPFISSRVGNDVELRGPGDSISVLPLPPEAPAMGAVRVVWVGEPRRLVYGLDFAAWYGGGEQVETFVVDDATYRTQLFPRLWSLAAARNVAALTDGSVALSTSGPSGLAVLRAWGPQEGQPLAVDSG